MTSIATRDPNKLRVVAFQVTDFKLRDAESGSFQGAVSAEEQLRIFGDIASLVSDFRKNGRVDDLPRHELDNGTSIRLISAKKDHQPNEHVLVFQVVANNAQDIAFYDTAAYKLRSGSQGGDSATVVLHTVAIRQGTHVYFLVDGHHSLTAGRVQEVLIDALKAHHAEFRVQGFELKLKPHNAKELQEAAKDGLLTRITFSTDPEQKAFGEDDSRGQVSVVNHYEVILEERSGDQRKQLKRILSKARDFWPNTRKIRADAKTSRMGGRNQQRTVRRKRGETSTDFFDGVMEEHLTQSEYVTLSTQVDIASDDVQDAIVDALLRQRGKLIN